MAETQPDHKQSRLEHSVETARKNVPQVLRSQGELGKVTIKTLWRAIIVEFIATGLFVFYACGTVVGIDQYGLATAAANLFAAVIQGYSIAAFVYAISRISGGHINPAVTLAMMITGHVGAIRALFYILAQLTGAIAGAALLKAVIPGPLQGSLGSTMLGENTSPGQGFLFEFILTAALLFVIYGTAAARDQAASGVAALAPIPIGYAVTIGVGIAYTFTGGSLNPARSFGPAVVSHTWNAHYVYWTGPLGAALFVGLLERYVQLASYSHEPTTPHNNTPAEGSLSTTDGQGQSIQAIQVVMEPGEDPIPMIPVNIDPKWHSSGKVPHPAILRQRQRPPSAEQARLSTSSFEMRPAATSEGSPSTRRDN